MGRRWCTWTPTGSAESPSWTTWTWTPPSRTRSPWWSGARVSRRGWPRTGSRCTWPAPRVTMTRLGGCGSPPWANGGARSSSPPRWRNLGVVLLALDTATPAVTVALHDGEQVVAESTVVDAMRHGELLAPGITAVLDRAGIVRQD